MRIDKLQIETVAEMREVAALMLGLMEQMEAPHIEANARRAREIVLVEWTKMLAMSVLELTK